MGDFFRGWQRKCGGVTLVMALAISFAWGTVVAFKIQTGHGRCDTFGSSYSGFFWVTLETDTPDQFNLSTEWNLAFDATSESHFLSFLSPIDSHWKFCGFHYASGSAKDRILPKCSQTLLMVPHWSLVLPLTLFSALLILQRPRQLNQAKDAITSEKVVDRSFQI